MGNCTSSEKFVQECCYTHAATEKLGVLLVNIGGPENLNDVQPFLCNLFADPDVIRLPKLFKFLQRPLAKLISILLAPKTKQRYAAIGGGSPLRRITDGTGKNENPSKILRQLHANVYVGMRYWYPFMEEAIQQQIKRDRITKLVLPLFPQFSITTTGSSIRVLQRIFMHDAYLSRLPVSIIRFWYQRQGYIRSIADSIVTQLSKFQKPEEILIFFSAHGVPVSYVENAGDPYKDQIEECIYLIMRELKARGVRNDHTLAYQVSFRARVSAFTWNNNDNLSMLALQSRVGPVQLLKPYTNLVELGRKGVKSLLAVPISFESEHIETLEEIDMGYKDLALKSGIENWGRVAALGCTSSFITDLADAVVEALPSAKALSILRETAKESDCR
ncbi:hypothetical protein J1N35_032432 [Gossypium stocksii]|uniref:Ferrochelatase n=1 Tax=Gossypium stocksii TaxID=47602 RepID=A0A9D3V3U7_9ROSI|nr:hypothetical protein J1N35_032432 [Gossypium stocksii]